LTPAKLNLFLEVHGRRADGYHELDSWFVAVDCCDRLWVAESSDGRDRLELSGLPIPGGGENLLWKALRLLRARRAVPPLSMHLLKRIPAGAGLGGGSGNAAGLLALASERFALGLSPDEQIELAAQVGSDVPFFLGASAARVRGRGERVEPMPGRVLPLYFVLVIPNFPVETRSEFSRLTFPLTSTDVPLSFPDSARNSSLLREGDTGRAAEAVTAALFNRLEPAAWLAEPRLIEFSKRLRREVPGPWNLSGSGSTYFRVCSTVGEAARLRLALQGAAGRLADPVTDPETGRGADRKSGRNAGRAGPISSVAPTSASATGAAGKASGGNLGISSRATSECELFAGTRVIVARWLV
jgi:4-diphosphocytidyl-2-C-methyl-D-erythritol kinase